MRINAFGEHVVDSKKDDIGLIEQLQEFGSDGVYAAVYQDAVSGEWSFDILENEMGELIVVSQKIFDTEQEVREFLSGYVSDIQVSS